MSDYTDYIAMCYGCYQALPENEKAALHAWEFEYVDRSGTYGTSNWPGWEKYLGKPPEIGERQRAKCGNVYLISCGTMHKIGIAADVAARMSSLQSANPNELKLVHEFYSENAVE